MKIKTAALPSLHCPCTVTPKTLGCLVPTLLSLKNHSKSDHKVVCGAVFFNHVRANSFLRFQDFDRSFERGDVIKRCCHVNLGGSLGEEPFEFGEENKGCCAISEKSLAMSRCRKKESKFPSQFDSLDLLALVINIDPPDWPERRSIMWANIEQKANNIGLPLSLRMIKKKLRLEMGAGDMGGSACCSVRKAFSSMVFIVLQLQTYALQMRKVVSDEDLDLIVSKVQREISASYVWLFQKVFSRTPALMLYVMLLSANFSVYSATQNVAIADTSFLGKVRACEIAEETVSLHRLDKNPDLVPEKPSRMCDQELMNETDIQLWDSIVDLVKQMKGFEAMGLNHEVMQRFVSPLSVDLEPDHFIDYYKMDFLYQMMLSQDPFNTLLLCNYAQFLNLVAQDYDRAEECFEQAMQVEPIDAEVLSQYASFLWTARKDLIGAEERYRQAVAVEPGNSYYASRYSNFLWSTGSEESCSQMKTS